MKLPEARRDVTRDVPQPVSNPFAGTDVEVDDDLEAELAELADLSGELELPAVAAGAPATRREVTRRGALASDEHRDVARRSYRSSSNSGGNQKLIVGLAIAAAAVGIVAFLNGRGGGDGDTVGSGKEGASPAAGNGGPAADSGGDNAAALAPPKAGESDEEIIARIVECLVRFFNSNSPEELVAFVRQPERVAPLVESYYADNDFAMPRFLDLVKAEEGMIGLKPFWEATVSLEGGLTRSMALQDTPEGFRVDWEIFVHYNPIPWEDYVKQRPAGPHEFRVYARLDYNPGYAFPEVDGWTCLELSAHGSGEILSGYARKGSELGKRLEAMLRDEYSKDCILKVEFPEDPKGGERQVWIRELVSNDWIRAD